MMKCVGMNKNERNKNKFQNGMENSVKKKFMNRALYLGVKKQKIVISRFL